MSNPIAYDLSASGGPKYITADNLTRLAVRAKTKVKATARGWSVLSQHEILALAWVADLLLIDGEQVPPSPAKPAPAVISNV